MPRRRPFASGEGPGLDLAPLIDMIFILLIFFMVTTTFVRDQTLDIERPGARSGERLDAPALRVGIDRRGRIEVEGEPVRRWMVQSRLRELLVRRKVSRVVVVCDRRVDSGRLVEIVDQCRLAGAREVGVAVQGEI